jgi:hypothetical protein
MYAPEKIITNINKTICRRCGFEMKCGRIEEKRKIAETRNSIRNTRHERKARNN